MPAYQRGRRSTFTTASGCASVTVTLAEHGLTAGQTYSFLVSTTGNGVTIFGTYVVQSIGSPSTYTIFAANTATGNGIFRKLRQRPIRLLHRHRTTSVGGWLWYGQLRRRHLRLWNAGPSGTGTPISAIDWTSGNWGQILLVVRRAGESISGRPTAGFRRRS